MYALADAPGDKQVQLLASGPMVREALRAQTLLAERFDVGSRVWSVTSYSALRREALGVERERRLTPNSTRSAYLEEVLEGVSGPFVAVSDWVRLVPEQIARFLPGEMVVLGTDGFGRSDTRETLRRHFEVNAEHIAYAALSALGDSPELLARARDELGIDAHAPDPASM
jgi:pyruvate dehydrogenase E1 component